MGESSNDRAEQEIARLTIAQLALDDDLELARALTRAVEVSGRTLGVTQVGVWVVPPTRDQLCLIAEFRLDAGTQGRPTVLSLPNWPAYEQLFLSQRIIAVDDARTDPRCAELLKDYLEPLGVGALLDAAVFVGGEVCAVVCHEHGASRRWQEHELAFAAAVADMLSALFEQASRLRVEELLRTKEHELARARRRDLLVQMSGGIAHDFRNTLQVILSSVALARRESDPERRDTLLAMVLDEAERANRLTRQLTDLARGRDVVLAPLDVVACVESLAPSLERIALDRGVRIAFELGGEPMRVKAERTLFERALTNLVSNAVEASSDGATVNVEVRSERGLVVVEVADRGVGVAPEHRERLFDPFFTTKDGGGTGLGLAVVALAAELFKGAVALKARDGGGAKFVVTIPASP